MVAEPGPPRKARPKPPPTEAEALAEAVDHIDTAIVLINECLDDLERDILAARCPFCAGPMPTEHT